LFPSFTTHQPAPDWIALSTEEQLDEIIRLSYPDEHRQAVAVFKHSTRCGVSRTMLRELTREWDIPSAVVPFYYLDLLRFRHISDSVASKFATIHQSPQLLIMREGKCIYAEAHGDISSGTVKTLLQLP
jgi:bacillithiol system protein YtxJ